MSIHQIYANSKKLTNVPRLVLALWLTIRLRDFITSKNIRPSFVLNFLNTYTTVNMETIVHLHIRWETLRLELFILCRRMLIFTCFISKQNGAHLTKNTTKLSVIMLIIGRILEESHTFSITVLVSCVQTGKQVHLLANMKRAAHYRQHVWNLIARKNKNIIH